MGLHRLVFLSFIAASACMRGQSVLASSERTMAALPASEVVFLVTVSGPLDRTLADAVQALARAQIQAQELAGRQSSSYSSFGNTSAQEFLFRAVRPMARFAELQSLLQEIASASRDLRVGFTSYSQSSEADIDTARATLLPDLFREAKARAEMILIESGYRPGSIVELAESVVRSGSGLSFSLAMRMARLGAAQTAPVVSTPVTPAAQPYRFGPPRLIASYYASAQGRAELFKLLKPAGVTEAQLTGLHASPYIFRDSDGVAFNYRFTIPWTGEEGATRAGKLPRLENSSFEIVFPPMPRPEDPNALHAIARSKAKPLAELLSGTLGESLGTADGTSGAITIPTRVIRSGDFSSNVIPAERINVVVRTSLFEPPSPPSRRYRFAVINAIP